MLKIEKLSKVYPDGTRALNEVSLTVPDGQFVVAGSIPGRKINVIDQKTEEVVWTVPTSEGVRPMAFDTNPDGSTKRIFVQLSGFNGFITVDFATHKVADTIKAPEVPAAERVTEGLQGSPSHGLAVSLDGKMLCSLSKMNTRVYMYSLPDLKLLGETKVGHHPDWLTFTPDGKRVYVANAGSKFDETPARELFLFLIQPALGWVKSQQLVLIPHAELNHLPFAALIDPSGKSLGEAFALSDVPSAGVLLDLKKGEAIAKDRLLAAADPGIDRGV